MNRSQNIRELFLDTETVSIFTKETNESIFHGLKQIDEFMGNGKDPTACQTSENIAG